MTIFFTTEISDMRRFVASITQNVEELEQKIAAPLPIATVHHPGKKGNKGQLEAA